MKADDGGALNRAGRNARRLAKAADRIGGDINTQAITGHPAFPPVKGLAHLLADLLDPSRVPGPDEVARARSVTRELRSPARSLTRHVSGLSLDRDPHYRNGTLVQPRDAAHSLVPYISPAHDRAQRLLAALQTVRRIQSDLARAQAAARDDPPGTTQ